MKLKNEALQKLYDKFVCCVFGSDASEQSTIGKAFRECDDELSDSITFAQIKDLQDRCDIFEKSNGTLLGANLDLATKKRQLEKDLEYFRHSRDDWKSRAKHAEDENARLKESLDIWRNSNDALLSCNVEEINEKQKLEKDLDDAKKQLDYFTQSRDDWRARAKHAEDEVMRTTETLEKVNADRNKLRKKLDFQQNDIVRLRKDRDRKDETIAKLAEMRDELQRKADDLKNELQAIRKDHGGLREEVKWYRNRYREQYDKIRELEFRLNSMCGDEYIKKLQDGVRGIGYKNGQTDLWDMLQNVNDAKPFELAACFQDVSCMADILSWDLEDFLDAYKSWQEKKDQDRIDDMRGYLDWFCMGRACCKCPLRTDEFKCGRGIWFRDIADEDIQRYYKKVREYYRDDNK